MNGRLKPGIEETKSMWCAFKSMDFSIDPVLFQDFTKIIPAGMHPVNGTIEEQEWRLVLPCIG